MNENKETKSKIPSTKTLIIMAMGILVSLWLFDLFMWLVGVAMFVFLIAIVYTLYGQEKDSLLGKSKLYFMIGKSYFFGLIKK